MDSVRMQFYLPAYMVWFLENYTNKTIETDFVLYAMDPQQSDVKLASYHKERFSLFNKEQLQTCAKFIEYCMQDTTGIIDTDFSQKKFERYWKQFL
ncbi:MAG: DUF6714 family protein [Bdellovibrionota bacterium]